MSKAENYPTEEVEIVADIRPIQLIKLAAGGLKRAMEGFRGVAANALNPEILLPGEKPEPLAVQADRLDLDALRKSGY